MKRNDQRLTTCMARSIGVNQDWDRRVYGLKRRILQERLTTVADPELRRGLELAGVDSLALAYTTPYPLLVLPALMDETFRAARVRVETQRNIRERTRPGSPLAALN